MKGKNTSIAQSVKDRLYVLSRERNESLQSLLVRYALERFLYRLGKSKHTKELILKGAFLFAYWIGPSCRTTKDLDMLLRASDEPEHIRAIFEEICGVDAGSDGLAYNLENLVIEQIREGETYLGLRLKFRASLGKAIIPIQVDLGFGDVVIPKPLAIDYPSLLDFPQPCILAYSPESVIAEKVEVMVQHGLNNSRMKDYYDVYFLLSGISFDRGTLAKAIEETFQRRGTEIPKGIPDGLSESFSSLEMKKTQWRSFIEKNRLTDAPADLSVAINAIRNLVLPIFAELNRKSSGKDR